MADKLQSRIDAFAQRLESALGDNLQGLLLYGSAARGDYAPGRSDINLLVVVRDASSAALRPAAEVIGNWARRETPPLIFSESEWRASADVFPLEIEDMRSAHRVIRGNNPLEGMTTTRDDLRRQVERELRGKLLHLRTEYAAVAKDGRALGELLQNSLGTFLVLFRATLRLAGRTPPTAAENVVRETADAASLDGSAFEWPLARRAGRPAPALRGFDPDAGRYVDQIEKLTGYVNSL